MNDSPVIVSGKLNVQTCEAMELCHPSASASENCFRAVLQYPAFWRMQVGYILLHGERIEHAWLISQGGRIHDPTLLISIDDVERYECAGEYDAGQLIDLAGPLAPMMIQDND